MNSDLMPSALSVEEWRPKVNPWLIAAAVMLATFLMGGVNLSISTSSIVWPCIVQGFGIGFAFVPMVTLAMATLRNEQVANARAMGPLT